MTDTETVVVILVSVMAGAVLLLELIQRLFPTQADQIRALAKSQTDAHLDDLTTAVSNELERLHADLANVEEKTVGEVTSKTTAVRADVLAEIAKLNTVLSQSHAAVTGAEAAVKNAFAANATTK